MAKPYSSFDSLADLDADPPAFPPIHPSRRRSRFSSDHLFSDDDDFPRHFLDSCFLCRKPLGVAYGRDIFMYRGDTPFCSEECRQEQIEMDESNEKKSKKSGAKSAAATSPSKSGKIHVRAAAGTVVAG